MVDEEVLEGILIIVNFLILFSFWREKKALFLTLCQYSFNKNKYTGILGIATLPSA